MDVGNYISSVLGKYHTVYIPGLGTFAYIRISSSYNDHEEEFSPPRDQLNFNDNAADDDVLVRHIAESKGISHVSARYFIEKYVSGLKHAASSGEAAIAGIGWLYQDNQSLKFKPDHNFMIKTDLFGYTPVRIARLKVQPVIMEDAIMEHTPPADILMPREPAGINIIESQEVTVPEPLKRKFIWLYLILSLIIFALLIYLINYKSDVMVRFNPDTIATVKRSGIDTDTAASNLPVTDTLLKQGTQFKENNIATRADTLKTNNYPIFAGKRYEVMGGSFKDMKEAMTSVKNYKSIGVKAQIAKDVPGKRVKLTLGTFKTRNEAEAARKELIKTKKVSKEIYTLEIRPKL